MNKISARFALSLMAAMLLTYCKPSKKVLPNDKSFPDVVQADQLTQTVFVSTLENNVANNRNVIYSSAFLYAWNEMKQTLHSPTILTNANEGDIKLVNESATFKNSLKKRRIHS